MSVLFDLISMDRGKKSVTIYNVIEIVLGSRPQFVFWNNKKKKCVPLVK